MPRVEAGERKQQVQRRLRFPLTSGLGLRVFGLRVFGFWVWGLGFRGEVASVHAVQEAVRSIVRCTSRLA